MESRRRGVLLGLLTLASCGELSSADARFATPERTVATLLTAHGVGDLGRAELQARFAVEGRLRVVDRAAFEACFVDLDQPGGRGLADYVVGMIAAARDELRYEVVEQLAYVVPRAGPRIVLERGRDGAFRIVLARSVPEEVRRELLTLEAAP